MPHSGGGGSHGGGSHGGSHGGSSGRTSHHYFPGARRFRRHYYDGRDDEYFYSSRTPRKAGLSGIIFFLLFGGFFIATALFSILGSAPRKLDENYKRPSSRIVDNIDIIDNSSDLEDVLEEYNDITGICPVVYTMCIEDYEEDYVDLESFAYNEYLREFDDERHYLFVYAIPESQLEDFSSGKLSVPDYEWEIMIGNDTDALYNETAFIKTIQDGLEDGEKPGEVFAKAVKEMGEYDEKLLSRSPLLSPTLIFPIVIILAFFSIPIIFMIRNYKKEKEFEFEEVPLTDEDIEHQSSYGSLSSSASSISSGTQKAAGIFGILFMIPFVLVGIGMIVGGLVLKSQGDNSAIMMTIFGLFWTTIVSVGFVSMLKNLMNSRKKTDDGQDEESFRRRYDDE